MQNAFREICTQPGFEEHLEETLERLEDCESLGRTREVVLKDLGGGSQYELAVKGATEGVQKTYALSLRSNE